MKDNVNVRMLKTTPGFPDGITRVTYMAGKVYEIPFKLANAFIKHMEVAEIETEDNNAEDKAEKSKQIEIDKQLKQNDMNAEADEQAEIAREEIAEQERRDEIKRKKAGDKAKKKIEEVKNKKANELKNK